MGKDKEEDEYVVHKIVGVKAGPKGEPVFRVRWKGYKANSDTWEPVDHLTKVLSMCNLYLINNGFKPLADSNKLQRMDGNYESESAEDIDEEEERPKKKPKKTPYQPVVKAAKTPTKESKQPSAKWTQLDHQVPGKPAALPKPSVTPPLPPVQSTSPKPQPLILFPPPKAPSLHLSESTRPRSPTPERLPESVVSGNNPLRGMRVRPADWEFDRPLQVLGCRVGAAGLEYSVLFAFDTGVVPIPKVVSHEELITKAPWLFARFFIANHKVSIP